MTDDFVSLDDRAVRRAFRSFLEADDALAMFVWYLELGYAWQDVQRHREEDRKLLRDVIGIRNLWATSFSGFGYGSVYVQ